MLSITSSHVTEIKRLQPYHIEEQLQGKRMAYEPPLRVTIALPNEFPRSFGINSTGKRGGNLRIRCTNKEYDAIQLEATRINISLAMFCRSCIVQVAMGLLEHREESSTSISVGEEDERRPNGNVSGRGKKRTHEMIFNLMIHNFWQLIVAATLTVELFRLRGTLVLARLQYYNTCTGSYIPMGDKLSFALLQAKQQNESQRQQVLKLKRSIAYWSTHIPVKSIKRQASH